MASKNYPWLAMIILILLFAAAVSLITWFFIGYASGSILPILAIYSPYLSLVFLVSFVFWLWMLVDSLKRGYDKDSDKFVWVVVIIFTWLIGAFLYYFMLKTAPALTRTRRKR